ncbi:MAG: DUF167 domain-containing protein [Patescibacteria group bacterium]|nr:DUF167 domain-containing protein [Patescibacteria group bacterium]
MYIKVKVKTEARKEEIEKINEDHYNISVKEKAVRNLANNRICEIMASIFGVKREAVRIINGHQSPSKLISVNIPE